MPRIDCFDIIKNNPELVSEFISITEDMPEVEQRKQAIQIVNKLLEASNESLNKVKRKVGQKPQKYNSGVSQDAIDEIIKKYSQPEQKETPQAESNPALRDVESTAKLEGYHYTDKDFSEFEQPTETQSLGNGVYFYLNKRSSNKKEVKADLSVKKILDWKNLSEDERNKLAKELESANIPSERLNNGKLVKNEFDSIEEAKKYTNDKKSQGLNVKTDLVDGKYVVEYKEKGLSTASNDVLRGLAAEFDPNIAKRLGYDAAKLGDEIVVFDAKNTKIKSESLLSKEQTPAKEEAPALRDVESKAKALEGFDKNAWGSDKGLTENFYTTDVDGYAIKKPITNPSSVTIDGVDFHIAKVDGDWKVIEKKSGLEISTGKTSNTKSAAIEDATMRLAQNGGAENLPTLIDRAIQGFKDRNAKAVESLLSKEQTEEIKYPIEEKGKWYGEEDYKSKGGELVEMSPDEFLSKVKYLDIDEEARDNINDLKEHIKSGKKLDPLTIYSADKSNVRNSDGRHRAIAAKELGIDKVPVIDYTNSQSLLSNEQTPQAGSGDVGGEQSLKETPNEGEVNLSTSAPKQSITKKAFTALTTMLKKAFPKVEFIGEKEAREIMGGSDKPSYQITMPDGSKKEVQPINDDVINGFYSPLEKIISETKFDKLPAKQWIDKFAKGEEAKWTGLTDWLNQQQGSVSKADIQQFLKDNRISVVEVVKGQGELNVVPMEDEPNILEVFAADDPNGDYRGNIGEIIIEKNGKFTANIPEAPQKTFNTQKEAEDYIKSKTNYAEQTKFFQYQIEGEKENYKEYYLVLPREGRMGKVADWRVPSAHLSGDEFVDNRQIVRLRMNTRIDSEGKKVLFIEEHQADKGQEGRKSGFKDFDKAKSLVIPKFDGKYWYLHEKSTGEQTSSQSFNTEASAWNQLEQTHNLMSVGVPSDPFSSDTNMWVKLGLKVALKEAVKQGEQMQRTAFEKLVDEKMDWVEARMKKLGKLEVKCP
jgi:hypothetical protein